jgi:hypothetical protein
MSMIFTLEQTCLASSGVEKKDSSTENTVALLQTKIKGAELEG